MEKNTLLSFQHIYDMKGRQVKNISKNSLNEKSLRIPIQDLNSGSYIKSILPIKVQQSKN